VILAKAVAASSAQQGHLVLTAHADSVELKLTVPDSERRATVAAMGMDPLEAQIRQVYFFDTPDLRPNSHEVVVRARRVRAAAGDRAIRKLYSKQQWLPTLRADARPTTWTTYRIYAEAQVISALGHIPPGHPTRAARRHPDRRGDRQVAGRRR
jgi:hypothetical protein